MSRFKYLINPDEVAEIKSSFEKKKNESAIKNKRDSNINVQHYDKASDPDYFKKKDQIGNFMVANACEGMNMIENIKGIEGTK